MEKVSKIKAEEEKQKKKEAKKVAAAKEAAAKQEAQKQQQHAAKKIAKPSAATSDQDSLSQDMSALGFESKAQAKAPPPTPPPSKLPASKRINVEEEYVKRSGDKPKLNLVVIGHVDAGKSTLMGHFLYDLGQVNDRTMKKYERDSQKLGKGSFAYAWVLDETGEERDRGITMDIATNYFETPHRKLTLLDAPGHRDFIPNMISGAAQAEAAILVVDASTGGFESGFDANGQTKEHALLARSLGVQQLIVAINKLDMMDWDETRFQEIAQKLGAFLIQAGFRKSNILYVPVSGLTGENLVKKSTLPSLTGWYQGPCLLDLVDNLDPPVRQLDKPLRLGVTDFFKGSGGVSVAGLVDAGHLQVGEQVMVVPGGEYGTIKAIQVDDETSNWAAAGDSVLITLTGLDVLNLSTGCVLCSPSKPVPVTTSFTAQIVVFDVKIPITCGFPVILHHQSLDEPASIIKLVAQLDKSTGQVVKRNPRHLGKGSTAKVTIQLSQRAIPLETFKENKQLGRIMLRRGGETVAAGVVDQILTFGS
ncbi:P-loop containing nucleoside triphosphate hydrolase protein [Syncephalastrum racemosum]|uniref:Elongation factor 1 alpha-like protein n=1 Tax=Syncephalastrum racemosum TaxID=13706 RepID=A0A1X2HRS9_SYNRA|nr:P-loop containing nucleoside triphosphate hydrolase protein [Syncephalastrum racemosum]